MKTDIINEFNATTTELLQTITGFSEEQFHAIPFEGSWTAAQVAEHLLKSESGIPKLWSGNTRITQRVPDEKLATIRGILLDFNTKLVPPASVLPSARPQGKEQLYKGLQQNRAVITQLANTTDISLTFIDYPFPKLGELTGIEWLAFLTYHTKRHVRQMQHIYERVSHS